MVAAEIEALATGVRADILQGISDDDVGMALSGHPRNDRQSAECGQVMR